MKAMHRRCRIACAGARPCASLRAAAACRPPAAGTGCVAADVRPQALAALFAASDEANLRRNPLSALFRGDLRYADRLGDFFSDAYYAAERARGRAASWRRWRAIDRDALSPSERISYDVFKWQRELDLRGLQPDMLALTAVRPIDHFNGFHTGFAELSSGESIAPFKTVKDYENGLGRIDDFVAHPRPRRSCACAQGLASGVVQPQAGHGQCRRAARRDARRRRRGQQLLQAADRLPGRDPRGRPGAAEGRLRASRSRPRSGRR